MKYLLILGLLPAFLLTSCKKDSTSPEVDEFSTLTQYLVQNDLDMNDLLANWVVAAGGLNVNQADYSVPDYYVIDLRSAEDFANGHIKDAHNTTLANVLVEAEKANGKQILVTCYTGQNAARATAALKLMGYDAKSLKWGMAGWHEDFAAKWNSKVATISNTNWVKTGDPAPNQEYSLSSFNTGSATGSEILRARVEFMLKKADWSVANADVLANPGNYFIVNKWPITSWDAFGHFVGAHRLDSEIEVAGLKWIDPSKTSVIYCYTGQTSSFTTAWLNVLGYDAKSLMFGVNAINYDEMLNSSSAKVTWKGASSGSVNNFGYYDSGNNMHGPL
jgi:rhodanese-related sulfurtransferase